MFVLYRSSCTTCSMYGLSHYYVCALQVELFLEQQSGLIDGYAGKPRFPSKYNMDITGLAYVYQYMSIQI